MARFLQKDNIRNEIFNLFAEAEEYIFLVSPFIKLTQDMRRALKRKIDDPDFHITVVYGKNPEDHSKSLPQVDMDFFKEFQNIEVYYNANLHAKYYANESSSIITSLNLHQFSLENNIEIGIMLDHGLLNLGKESKLDREIYEYIENLTNFSETIFQKGIRQDSYFFGLIKGKSSVYIGTDKTEQVYHKNTTVHVQVDINKAVQKQEKERATDPGYCIRTGKKIPFNLEKPYCFGAFKEWSINKQKKYFPEKYCHFSGELSNGETCFERPVMRKNYAKAMSWKKQSN